MMRADMDGLPVEEKSGLENASRAQQKDPMHWAINRSHDAPALPDVHITSLVGTARYMAGQQGQPVRHVDAGRALRRSASSPVRCGTMTSGDEAGRLRLCARISRQRAGRGRTGQCLRLPYAGADTVDIIIHGVGAHGAHRVIPARTQSSWVARSCSHCRRSWPANCRRDRPVSSPSAR